MKRLTGFGTALLVAAGGLLRADDVVPQPLPADRYAKMAAHSPFAPPTAPVATPPPATPAPTPSPFDKYTVVSIMQTAGKINAIVLEQDSGQHYYLSSDKESPNTQLQIASIKDYPPKQGQTPVVTLRKGTLFGTVRYDPGSAGGGQAPGAIPGSVSRPAGVGMPNQALNRMNTPPPIPGSGAAGNPGMPNSAVNSAVRRPTVIPAPRAQPPPAVGGRPVVLPGSATQPGVVRPGVTANDDDDDDD